MTARRWLLEVLAESIIGLRVLGSPLMRQYLNVRNPPGGQGVLADTVWAAWNDGLLTFSREGDTLEPRGHDEYLAYWEGEEDPLVWMTPGVPVRRRPAVRVGLTSAGGAWWSARSHPDWRCCVQTELLDESDPQAFRRDGLEVVRLTGIDRDVLGAVEARAGGVRVGDATVEDWRPRYWLPGGPAHTLTMLLPDATSIWRHLPAWRSRK